MSAWLWRNLARVCLVAAVLAAMCAVEWGDPWSAVAAVVGVGDWALFSALGRPARVRR